MQQALSDEFQYHHQMIIANKIYKIWSHDSIDFNVMNSWVHWFARTDESREWKVAQRNAIIHNEATRAYF